MGLVEQDTARPSTGSGPGRHRRVEPVLPAGTNETRVNWLYSGVLFGAAGWLLVLAVIFAFSGALIVAGALLCGLCGCLLPVWRAGRRLR